MSHSGHETVKCECGRVLKNCRCPGPKPERTQSPCECADDRFGQPHYGHREAVDALFAATPDELGAAAVAEARRGRELADLPDLPERIEVGITEAPERRWGATPLIPESEGYTWEELRRMFPSTGDGKGGLIAELMDEIETLMQLNFAESRVAAENLASALRYAGHKHNCDAIQPMWHKGPCDCGWEEAQKEISQTS